MNKFIKLNNIKTYDNNLTTQAVNENLTDEGKQKAEIDEYRKGK